MVAGIQRAVRQQIRESVIENIRKFKIAKNTKITHEDTEVY